MKKLAIILDSFCGKSKNDVEKKKDMFFIPLQIEIENKTIKVGINKKNDEQIINLLDKEKKAKTSMPTPADILDVFKKTSNEYESVIYLPLSSAISGTARAAMGLAQDFNNVSVIETHLVGKSFFIIAQHLIKKSNEKNLNIEKIKSILANYIKNDLSQAYVIPWSFDNLIASGRISKIASNILEKFKVVPIISYEWDNKKLHNRGLKKSGKKAIDFAISKLISFILNKENFVFLITYTPGRKPAEIAEKILLEKKLEFITEKTSPIIDSVCGKNAISISAFKKI